MRRPVAGLVGRQLTAAQVERLDPEGHGRKVHDPVHPGQTVGARFDLGDAVVQSGLPAGQDQAAAGGHDGGGIRLLEQGRFRGAVEGQR
ncbi:hypothetical protein [Streptomyces eurythermus]|uniref:hypothetical protein n=1 Tax=Streptomyces eurythermus TaxID=42237 RepID=UPI0033E8CCBE